MTFAAKSELGALYITAQKMMPMRKTLIEIGWPQPPTPIQTDNTTYEGVVNNTSVAQKWKSTDLQLHWLRCHEAKKSCLLGQRTQQLR